MLKVCIFRNATHGVGYILKTNFLFGALNISQVQSCSKVLDLQGSQMHWYLVAKFQVAESIREA